MLWLLQAPDEPQPHGSLTPMGVLVKMQIPGLRDSDTADLGWGQGICIFSSPPKVIPESYCI